MTYSVTIDHTWYDGPHIAVTVLEDGKWVPFGYSEIVDQLDSCFSLFDEEYHIIVFPRGRYLFTTEDNKLHFIGGAVVE